MRAELLSMIVGLGMLSGCRNDCQQLCVAVRDYASEECGLVFDSEEFRQCLSDQGRGDLRKYLQENFGDEDDAPTVGDRLATCERDLANLRDEVTCEDLEEYFTNTSSGGGGNDTSN
jgi:hypothetical protein